MITPDQLLRPTPAGLYCAPGDFYIDPMRKSARAVITHGHADHARAGHESALATPETLAVMEARYGKGFCGQRQALRYGDAVDVNGVRVSFLPAGHVFGSAQAVLEWKGLRIAVSGDYKRRRDPTCAAFEPPRAHIYVTEATFGLPVFRHPDDAGEVAKLLASREAHPERAHFLGAYSLGKGQRMIKLLREAGYDRTIYIHDSLEKICALYQAGGVDLGALAPFTGTKAPKRGFAGDIVVAPPQTLRSEAARKLAAPVACFASGWMRVRGRARGRGVELPLIISDHADWDELTQTLSDISPEAVWITHGAEAALMRWCALNDLAAKPLALVGYGEDETGDEAPAPQSV